MLNTNITGTKKYRLVSAVILGLILGSMKIGDARAIDAGDVMSKMNPDMRYGYVTGVIEGLAFARWTKDKPDNSGMNCIYKWFYTDKEKQWGRITQWLERHPDKSVGPLMHVLTKRECGA